MYYFPLPSNKGKKLDFGKPYTQKNPSNIGANSTRKNVAQHGLNIDLLLKSVWKLALQVVMKIIHPQALVAPTFMYIECSFLHASCYATKNQFDY